ncbi:MFS transporter, partial [Paenibacillus sepulcri]|nr:MFS transporter [Paenibacillus sepulcri]
MPAEEAQAQMGKRIFNEKWTVPLLALTVMIVIMNTMMFNLALPSITMQFELTATVASWIVTGYSIVFAISSITYSRLSDFVPLRTLFTIGLLLLGLASLIGLFSSSFPVLLLARLLQASGAGSILSMSIILITRNVPEQRRGKAISFVISSSSLGFGLGPVLGGAIMQFWGWNDLFAVTALVLPLIPLYLILLPREKAGSGTFDAWGALLTGIGTTGLLLFLTTQRWEMLVIGLVAVGLFILRIRSASNPFVAPSLFGNRPYLSLAALGMASYMNNFAVLFLMPQILVHLFGLSSLQSGLIIFPGAILSMLAARSIGRIIDRQ